MCLSPVTGTHAGGLLFVGDLLGPAFSVALLEHFLKISPSLVVVVLS